MFVYLCRPLHAISCDGPRKTCPGATKSGGLMCSSRFLFSIVIGGQLQFYHSFNIIIIITLDSPKLYVKSPSTSPNLLQRLHRLLFCPRLDCPSYISDSAPSLPLLISRFSSGTCIPEPITVPINAKSSSPARIRNRTVNPLHPPPTSSSKHPLIPQSRCRSPMRPFRR